MPREPKDPRSCLDATRRIGSRYRKRPSSKVVPPWDSESFFVSLTFVSTQPRPKSEKMRTMADCRFSHHTTRGGISLSDHCIVEWIGGELGTFFCWRRQRRSKGAEEQEGKKEKVKNTGRKKSRHSDRHPEGKERTVDMDPTMPRPPNLEGAEGNHLCIPVWPRTNKSR